MIAKALQGNSRAVLGLISTYTICGACVISTDKKPGAFPCAEQITEKLHLLLMRNTFMRIDPYHLGRLFFFFQREETVVGLQV